MEFGNTTFAVFYRQKETLRLIVPRTLSGSIGVFVTYLACFTLLRCSGSDVDVDILSPLVLGNLMYKTLHGLSGSSLHLELLIEICSLCLFRPSGTKG